MCDIRLKIAPILYGRGNHRQCQAAQINPKWQHGGLSPINSIRYEHETGKPMMINGKNSYISLSPADSFFALHYAHGDIANGLRGR